MTIVENHPAAQSEAEVIKEQRGKRKAAFRFELYAMMLAAFITLVIIRGEIDSAIKTMLSSFGTVVFLASLGYAAALRGIDSYANEVVKGNRP